MAHILEAVSAYVNSKSYDTKCGQLDSVYPKQTGLFRGVVLLRCTFMKIHASSYHLCQLDDPLNRTLALESSVPMPSTVLYPHKWDSRFTICPSRHAIHSFLACDKRTTCWAQGVASFSSERATWDLPSPLSCPVPGMTSLPPSYRCVAETTRVPYTFVCDHRQDCGDNSDEEFCQFAACRAERPLQCGNIKQVARILQLRD